MLRANRLGFASSLPILVASRQQITVAQTAHAVTQSDLILVRKVTTAKPAVLKLSVHAPTIHSKEK